MSVSLTPSAVRHVKKSLAKRGSGIGLWLSREIAVNLGGSLTVHSTVGEGSVFRLTL